MTKEEKKKYWLRKILTESEKNGIVKRVEKEIKKGKK